MNNIKKILFTSILCLTSYAAFGAEVKIEVVNISHHIFHITASDGIVVYGNKSYPHSYNDNVVFSNVNTNDSFEIYFQTIKTSEPCAVTYDMHKGLIAGQCPKRRYVISDNGNSITFK